MAACNIKLLISAARVAPASYIFFAEFSPLLLMPHERTDHISMFEAKLANPLRVVQRLACARFKEALMTTMFRCVGWKEFDLQHAASLSEPPLTSAVRPEEETSTERLLCSRSSQANL